MSNTVKDWSWFAKKHRNHVSFAVPGGFCSPDEKDRESGGEKAMSSKAFLLSGEALKQLEGLAERYDVSEVDVLEYLIRVRSRTSNPHENAMRFAYTAGFNAGWNQFQTRHDLPEDAKFLKPIKEDT